MGKLYIHVGYPKTGTTTLQKAVFQKLHDAKAIAYLGMFGFENDKDSRRKTFFQSLTNAMYIESDEEFEKQLHSLKEKMLLATENFDQSMPLVLSNEHFTLSQTSTKIHCARIDVFRTASRLAQVFDGFSVDILLCVRRQDQLAWSLFLENRSRPRHAHALEYCDANRFLIELAAGERPGRDAYNFHDVIQAYKKAFPNGRQLIWAFEAFRQNPARTVAEILQFLEVPDSLATENAFDLKPQNVKSSQKAPISFIKPNRAINLASRALQTAGVTATARAYLKAIFSIILPKDRPKYPTDFVMNRFLEEFVEVNKELATLRPELTPHLAEYGYLGTATAEGRSK